MEKAAYVAVGAPMAALKAISARLAELGEAIDSSRRDMSEDLASEMSQWVTEGEQVVERAMERFRASVSGDIRRADRKPESGATKATGRLEEGLDAVSPNADLSRINGIGPSYAEKLTSAGIAGIADFLSRTGTTEDQSTVAQQTGFSVGTVESWRSQVDLSQIDGLGGEYQRLLHELDVWTLRELSEAEPQRLADQTKTMGLENASDRRPSIYQVKQWVDAAEQLTRPT